MARPRSTVISPHISPNPLGADARCGIAGGVRRWWARLWRRRMTALPELNNHLRRDLGLPALGYRHGYDGRARWWTCP